MAGSRVQQTCAAPSGENHRGREKRRGWPVWEVWQPPA
jgi:hypothetical protein